MPFREQESFFRTNGFVARNYVPNALVGEAPFRRTEATELPRQVRSQTESGNEEQTSLGTRSGVATAIIRFVSWRAVAASLCGGVLFETAKQPPSIAASDLRMVTKLLPKLVSDGPCATDAERPPPAESEALKVTFPS